MRNLKKILALALALVMTLSLMTVANAFNDDADIDETYAEAVEVLSGLNVFKGVEDGSNFAPKQTITRAEVAAIIYRIVTGDVTDTQEGIYADYAKFADVADTHWAAGYIGYCANAELVVGDGTNFYPGQTVTGYQALAMILRALGYDQNDEFKGTGWEIRVASTAQQKGILKNINAGTLGTAATREMVAEILFQAIANTNTVYYLTNTMSYQDAGSTLGYQTFGLERIEGVVVSNEYADLKSSSAEAAGVTVLETEDGDRTLNISTELTDIGESRYAYVTGRTVLSGLTDTGLNEVFETGEGTAINATTTGMNVSSAEKFLNFGETGTERTSDWRIEYVVTFTTGSADRASLDDLIEDYGLALENTDFTYEQNGVWSYSEVIRANDPIDDDAYTNIEAIFAASDSEDDPDEYVGEVYVGTRSTRDVSDYMSFRQFENEYIDVETVEETYNASDNGEWLKVVDNDGDGVAEYVFLTEFAMSIIERISNSGVYTLTALDGGDDNDVAIGTTTIRENVLVTSDDLAAGDVVLYTLIDGKYYVDLAEVVTETVDARGINSREETMTCDGTVYTQSHIGYADKNQHSYYTDVTEGHTEYTYDLYLDHFGFVRMFIESDYDAFLLLTDGYYENNGRSETFQAMYWDVSGDEEVEIDLANNTAEFINDRRTGITNVETWGRLVDAGTYYGFTSGKTYITNIAGYAAGTDGYTLVSAEDSTRRTDYDVQELSMTGLELDDQTIYAADDSRIQTTTNTQYYLVIKSGDKVADVLTWTGYNNEPAEAALADDAVGYTVTHEGNGSYDVADVVVFETDPTADRDTYFVYEINNWANLEYVWGIGYFGDEIDAERVDVDGRNGLLANGGFQFYVIDENGNVLTFIDEDYASYGIHAGEVTTTYDVSHQNYIRVEEQDGDELMIYPETDVIYYVHVDQNGLYVADEVVDWDDIRNGEDMILFTDGRGDVLYAIAVDQSEEADGDSIANLGALFTDIYTDYVPTTLEAAIAAANAALYIEDEGDAARDSNWVTWDTAVARYNALKDLIDTASMTAAERTAATTALDNLATRMMYVAQTDAKEEIQAEYNALAPSYSNNISALDTAKAAADAEVDAWTITTVLDGYVADIPAIDLTGIDNDTVAMANARQAALADIEAAKTAAMTLDKDYADGRLNSAITLAYDAAVKAVNEAATVAAVQAAGTTGVTNITATVADAQLIADAVEWIDGNLLGNSETYTRYGEEDVEGYIPRAVPGVTAEVTRGTQEIGVYYNFSAELTAGAITYTHSWTFRV